MGNWGKEIWRKYKEEVNAVIKTSRYCKEYINWKEPGFPKYMEGSLKSKIVKEIARNRCGNEVRASRFWNDKEKRRCRLCEQEEESMDHVMKKCRVTGNSERKIEMVLNGRGEGYEVMKEIREKRDQREREKKKEEEERREIDRGDRRRKVDGKDG